MRLNRTAQRYWRWKEGQRIPNSVRIALGEIARGDAYVLPIRRGQQHLFGVHLEDGRGWLLVGVPHGGAWQDGEEGEVEARVPLAVTGLDEHGLVLSVRGALRKLTGVAPPDALGRRLWSELIEPADRLPFAAALADATGGHEAAVVVRLQGVPGEGPFEIHLLPSCGQAPIAVEAVIVDCSAARERPADAAATPDAAAAPDAAENLKAAFVATLSHEIRTPLGAVNGFAELLARELDDVAARMGHPLPEEVTEFLEAIRENAQRLLTLVNDLFDLSNLEAGTVSMRRVAFELAPLVRRSAAKIAASLADRGIGFDVEIGPEHAFVMGDPQRVEQVLDNLLSNAAKFTDAGEIMLRVWREEEQFTVEVRDTGVGIAADHLQRLFVPFSQEDFRLNRRFPGAGIGLALVKRLLERMGGRIEVESVKGEGTTFRFTLPAAG